MGLSQFNDVGHGPLSSAATASPMRTHRRARLFARPEGHPHYPAGRGNVVDLDGLEPTTSDLQNRRSPIELQAQSNPKAFFGLAIS